MKLCCVDVLLPIPLDELFTYSIPSFASPEALLGCRVVVSFGHQEQVVGLIVSCYEADVQQDIKPIIHLLDEQPIISALQLDFWKWIATYYLCSLGEVMKTALPSFLLAVNKTKNAPGKRRKKITSTSFSQNESVLVYASVDQTANNRYNWLDELKNQWEKHAICLLKGLPFSDRFPLYVSVLAACIEKGESVLVLTPEIPHADWLFVRLREVFGERCALYHTGISLSKKSSVWQAVATSQVSVVVGVRSALFLPFQRLGCVVVEDEHHPLYKQQDTSPRFHVRNAALVLAEKHEGHVLLESASPSIETYAYVQTGKYGCLDASAQPSSSQSMTQVVNTRELSRKKQMNSPVSPPLWDAMDDCLKSGRQVILFHNRKGYASWLSCKQCGWVYKCPQCQVSLTYYRSKNLLSCPYCSFSLKPDRVCPSCHEETLVTGGFGTEQLEEIIRLHYPDVGIVRLDADKVTGKKAFRSEVARFERGEAQVLIGTRLIFNGIDFSHVGLTALLDVDRWLSFPDFRANERTFQLITQLSEIAWLSEEANCFVIQTTQPDHPVIRQAINHDYKRFFEDEISIRRAFGYPPFKRLIRLTLWHRQATVLLEASSWLAIQGGSLFNEALLGPDKLMVHRGKAGYFQSFLLKWDIHHSFSLVRSKLLELRERLKQAEKFKSVRLIWDVDPVQ
jgi:primosomal protein N' (replication factor Y)